MDIHRYSGPMMMLWCCCDLNKVSFSFFFFIQCFWKHCRWWPRFSSLVPLQVKSLRREIDIILACSMYVGCGRNCLLGLKMTQPHTHTHWMTHRNTREKMSQADDERRCLMSSVNHEIESTRIWDSTGKSRRCQKILESVELITGFFLFLFYYHCGIYAIYVSISLTQHFLFRIRHFLALHTHQL